MNEYFNNIIWDLGACKRGKRVSEGGDQLPTTSLFRRFDVHGEEFGRFVGRVLLLTIFALSGRTPGEGHSVTSICVFSMHPIRSLCLSIQLEWRNRSATQGKSNANSFSSEHLWYEQWMQSLLSMKKWMACPNGSYNDWDFEENPNPRPIFLGLRNA